MTPLRCFRFFRAMLPLGLVAFTFAGPVAVARASDDAAPPLGTDDAAHLLRRAGFGGSPEQVAYVASLSRREAVDLLVDYDAIPFAGEPYPHNPEDIRVLEDKLANATDLEDQRRYAKVLRRVNEVHLSGIRRWWFRRMVATPRPLEERMTLFWHGHFVSAHPKVGWMPLYWQNRTLREHAVANFRDLAKAVSRDPAMILYLDMASNVVGHANENFARELLELFLLGPGHYTEDDVQEISRVFTGYRLDDDRHFVFDPKLHDDGEKTIFGKTANFDGDALIDLIFEQPACAVYLARALYEEFVLPDAPDDRVQWLASEIRRLDFDVKETLRVLLSSDDFFADEARFSRVRSPIELIVGVVRMLEVAEANSTGLYTLACDMGQDVFHAPTVAGWDGDRAWITSQTLALRYNFARHILGDQDPEVARNRQLSGRLTRGREQFSMMADVMTTPSLSEVRHNALLTRPWDPSPILERYSLRSADAIVEHFVDRLLQQPLAEGRLDPVMDIFAGATSFDPESADLKGRVRDLVALLLSMPESQIM